MKRSDRDLVRMLGQVGDVFFGVHDGLFPIQSEAIESVFAGIDVFVSASTASGKTEAIVGPMVARLKARKSSGQRIRLLVITPTRALVNDLYERLTPLLSNVGWRCGRQTGDHRNRDQQPDVLITTPESFESTMVAGFLYDTERRPSDHLLAAVEGIFLDEGHCYASTLRGDHLMFLVNRLRRLREWAMKKGILGNADIQVCSASATVANAQAVAQCLLGQKGVAIGVSDSRKIEFLNQEGAWMDVSAVSRSSDIHPKLPVFNGPHDLAEMLLEQRVNHGMRKVLIFTQSRSLCDNLASGLRQPLQTVADIWIGAHHSSLSRELREAAEHSFSNRSDAVLVSTSTMEVGVDIGDVDAVCLVGAPPTVASLLQRIGRGNRRRRGLSRIIAVPKDSLDSYVLASQLAAASSGAMAPVRFRRHWSVFVQQVLCHIMQSHGEGRSMEALTEMAERTWPGMDTRPLAHGILEGLCQEGVLCERRSKLIVGERIGSKMKDRKAHYYANFDSSTTGLGVFDQSTGAQIGQIGSLDTEADEINFGGNSYRVRDIAGSRIEVTRSKADEAAAVRYASRRLPRLEEYCGHVRNGAGLSDSAAPLVIFQSRSVWFHFGGEVWDRLFECAYPPGTFGCIVQPGIAVECNVTARELQRLMPDRLKIERASGFTWESVARLIECGRFFELVPVRMRQQAAEELLDPDFWVAWIASRNIETLGDLNDPKRRSLLSLLGSPSIFDSRAGTPS